jgi:hypothetical protein
MPLIEDGLADLGFQVGKRTVKVRAARLPFTVDALDRLKSTSAKTGLPQTVLKAALNRVAQTPELTDRGPSRRRRI